MLQPDYFYHWAAVFTYYSYPLLLITLIITEFKLAQHISDSVSHSVNQRMVLAAKAQEQSLCGPGLGLAQENNALC